MSLLFSIKPKMFKLLILLMLSVTVSAINICGIENCQNCTYGFFVPSCNKLLNNTNIKNNTYCHENPVCCQESYSQVSDHRFCSNFNMYPLCKIVCREEPININVELLSETNKTSKSYVIVNKLIWTSGIGLILLIWRFNVRKKKIKYITTKLTSFVPIKHLSNIMDDMSDNDEE